ncbi:FecR family protein [Pedobacter lusitanus]|uniref:FecR family protein n=1 Tax=Pedobacter lusitanus TaxID=1503925 RepID=UPI00069773B5|nr:FecR domain-containing protein [Pedobacter lusitanus]
MQKEEALHLLEKYNKGTATAQERAIVEHWYLKEAKAQDLTVVEQKVDHLKAELWSGTLAKAGLAESPAKTFKLWPKLIAAAAVFLLIGTGVYLFNYNTQYKQPVNQLANDVKPGSAKALLTLSNGRTINLDVAADGKIAEQQGVTIAKTADGQISYASSQTAKTNQEISFNTIQTPNGGEYRVNLPDGTKVWLNAGSSLKYPTVFNARERRVELTGEGYFEVKHEQSRPFRVITPGNSGNGQLVEVLGTHFNINCYPDETTIHTTLLEGSVRVSEINGKKFRLLKPGEEALKQDGLLTIHPADLDEVMAWRNGKFKFNDEDIVSIMKKIARWYNLSVEYQDEAIKKERFSGTISRFENVSELLKKLELTNTFQFRIQGSKVILSKPKTKNQPTKEP